MQENKSIEIKHIDAISVFKFFGGTFFLIGLILGLFSNILKIDIISTDIMRIFPFMARLGPGIFAGILSAFLYGFSAGIGSLLLALLYNFFAALFGGLKFGLKD